jgi:D-arginine dehydrogenase
MDTHDFDVAVIGAGIAGSTAAAALAADRRVALIEAEEAAGYHTTGRSAAVWILNYGPPDVRTLSGLSRPFFEHPPAGFAEVPLMSQRPVVFMAPEAQSPLLETMLAEGVGLREISVADLRQRVPALRPDYAVAAAIEEDAFDMDVAALHQGYLRQLRARGGVLALRHRGAGRIERRKAHWEVATSAGAVFRAPVVVNAAGAWGDAVAAIAGVAPIGLTPCRRTAAIIDPSPYDVTAWPLLNDAAHTWYARRRCSRTTCSPTSWTSPSPSTGCSKRWTFRSGASSAAGPGCAASRRTAAWRSVGTATRPGSSGASARAATASRHRPPRENWSPT